jgi:hypothetical protein
MKRLNADPVFAARRDAVSSERMKRLHADPVFAAKQAAAASEAMKRVNAHPVLAARKAAARSILTEAIIAALSVAPNATRVAKQTGVVTRTVQRVAKAAGVKLTRGRPRLNRSEPPGSLLTSPTKPRGNRVGQDSTGVDKNVDDGSQLGPLLEQIAGPVASGAQ